MNTTIEEYVQIDKRIDAGEEDAAESLRETIRDRWEFGRLLLAERKGKQLPNGMLDELMEATGKSRAELKFRAQFAERYPTEDKVATAIATFTSWTQIKKSLPEQKRDAAKPKPASPPTRSKKAQEIVDRAERGESREEIAQQTGAGDRTVRRELELNALEEEVREEAMAESVDYDSAPLSAKAKVDGMVRRRTKDLEKEYRTRLLAEVDQYKAACDANVAAYKAKLDERDQRLRASRDAERERYNRYIEVARAKGLITPGEYETIRSCLHPDSRLSASDEKLATAFRLFNDEKIKILLVKEK